MEKGEEKQIKLQPSEAYGNPNSELIKSFPRDQFPKEQELKAGMLMILNLPNGIKIPAIILDVNDKEIKIDLNHPLSGKVLNFKIKIIEVSS